MSCEACRTIPPVVATGYTPKGQFETIAGLNTYVTGNADAQIGLVDIYDVFGMASQTIQGADLLAARLNAVVLIPDFFDGEPLKHEYVPADTDEKKQIIADFMAHKANISRNVDVVIEAVKEYHTRFSSVRKWGAFGLCWGGKVTVLTSGPNTPFAASGQVHPGRMDAADAQALSIPHIVLASKDEPADAIAGYADLFAKEKEGYIETYSTMWHGWMGARANLEQEESQAQYARGYNQLADFFEKHLS
ncbi:uncharacterized protein N7496_005632 [Penicillium cataractarum]|uniref:Dienelactone hydrolase domain-containing protein n=1 Tax=Penicillium cataractarum TaxID=2100454 RepID=A0A9W9SKX8_9EURO|nr:uncharacterized protein N7496_005632 [Penicillium cataractarum]KAJ5378223.1 hypothetical protein N7496_005632 [Penicillium cataractarum]